MKLIARKSIVAARNIEKGEIISQGNVCFKRPGSGLPPIKFEKIKGMKSKIFIKKNSQIKINFLNN